MKTLNIVSGLFISVAFFGIIGMLVQRFGCFMLGVKHNFEFARYTPIGWLYQIFWILMCAGGAIYCTINWNKK